MTRPTPGYTILLLSSLTFAASLSGRAAPPAAPSVPADSVPVDLVTLKQALAPLSSTSGLTLNSDFTATGQQPGMTFSFHNHMQVTARRPQRFHVDLTRDNGPGTKQQHYVLVSNGAKVWTYNAGANKYSVISLAAYGKSDEEIFCEGLATGILYLGDGFTLPQALQSITAANSAAVLASMKKDGILLTEQMQIAGGQSFAVYRLSTKENLVIDLFVSAAKQLSAVEITAPYQGMQLTLRENISQIAALPSSPPSVFIFTPPLGAVKSAGVSVGP